MHRTVSRHRHPEDLAIDPAALAPFLIGSAATDALVAVVFFSLYRRHPEDHLFAWGLSWTGSVAVRLLLLGRMLSGGHSLVAVLLLGSLFGQCLALLWGTARLARRGMPRGWLVAAALAVFWAGVSDAFSLPGLYDTLPTFAVLSGMVLHATFWLGREQQLALKIAALPMLGWSVNLLATPLLSSVGGLPPIAHVVGDVLRAATGLALVLGYYETIQERMFLSESRFRSIFDNALDGMFTADRQHLISANPALLRMLGYADAERVAGLVLAEDVFSSPRDATAFLDDLRDGAVTDREVEWRKADGELLTVSISGTVVWDVDGGFSHIEGFVRDVTEANRLREELFQAQKMEAVGRLAGGIAHDFNNLLTVIQGNATLLEDFVEDQPRPSQLLERIVAASNRAAGLTRQLLAFSRRGPQVVEAVDLGGLASRLGMMLERTIGEDVQLQLVASDGCCVRADPAQMEQVLLNLVFNARDAMPEGGTIRVTVTSVLNPVELERHTGSAVIMEVIDTGHGIPADVLPQVFEPFFTTRETGKGTGLGLSTVYGIVSRLGGTVDVESTVGEGTKFRIVLPAIPADQLADVEPSVGTPMRGEGVALLVEDEPTLRKVSAEILRRGGFEVVVARDGEHAFEVLQTMSEPVDILVTDMVMPHMDGMELAERLRARWPALPVVFVSGYPDRVTGASNFLRPGQVFLAKPFLPHQLLNACGQAALDARARLYA